MFPVWKCHTWTTGDLFLSCHGDLDLPLLVEKKTPGGEKNSLETENGKIWYRFLR